MFFCSSDLAQGFALKTLTDILASFLSKEPIKRVFKGRLLSTVLHGYLSLRRLVVQRTKLVDQTQEKMLELLEDMTSGTLEETKNFMAICVQTIDRYSLDDQVRRTQFFDIKYTSFCSCYLYIYLNFSVNSSVHF